MTFFQKLTDQRFAQSAARFMRLVCWFLTGLLALCTLLSFMGRQTFFLHTEDGNFESAICAEKDHDPQFRGMTVGTDDDIHVWTDGSGRIGPAVWIGLSLMYAVYTIPIMLAFWFLGRVFSNICEGQIFTERNAACLLYYGLLQIFAAVFVPFFRLLACPVISLISGNQMSVSTGQNVLGTLIPGIAFLVAAYIIHYGVNLQDEVDHTL